MTETDVLDELDNCLDAINDLARAQSNPNAPIPYPYYSNDVFISGLDRVRQALCDVRRYRTDAMGRWQKDLAALDEQEAATAVTS